MTTPGGKIRTPAGDAPVVPVMLLAAGMYLAWFGVHYWRSDVKYPTDPVKAVLQGRPVPASAHAEPAAATLTADIAAFSTGQAGGAAAAGAAGAAGGGGGGTPGQPVSSTAAHNQAIGRMLAARYGWSGSEFDALVTLWNGESGWNNTAENTSSGAYGIPQALPYSKMPKAAWPPRYGGSADPSAQISWGLAYIKDRYGSPSAALAAWQARSPHWY